MGDDRVEKFLASYHLGQYINPIGPPIQGIELLKYRIPLKNISNIGTFYLPSLNLWYKINPKVEPYPKDKCSEDHVFYNPQLLDKEGNTFRPLRKTQYARKIQQKIIPQNIKHFPFLGNNNNNTKASLILHTKINSTINTLPISCPEEPLPTFKNKGKKITSKFITSKILYQIILPITLNAEKVWEDKWSNNLNNNQLQWQNIWPSIHKSITSYQVQTTIWQQITGAYFGIVQSGHVNNTVEKCNYCLQIINQKHHFHLCPTINQIYDHFLPILNSIYNHPLSTEEKVLGINNTKFNRAIALRNYFTFNIRHYFHKTRFVDNLGPPSKVKQILISKIKNAIRKDMLYNYGIALSRGQNAVTLFTNKFLINNVLATIDQEKTLVHNI